MNSSFNKYEIKSCPRCGAKFECKPGNITQCQCYNIILTNEENLFIKELYDDCLCIDCLRKLKELYNQRKTIQYFQKLKSE